MSKRAQTTGAPKRRRRRRQEAAAEGETTAQARADSSFTSRAEREEQLQKWVIRGVAAVVGILLLLVAIAFAFRTADNPQPDGPPLCMARASAFANSSKNICSNAIGLLLQLNQVQNAGFDLQQLAQQEPYSTWLNEVNVPDQLGLRVLNDMVDARLLAQEAAALNVGVDATRRAPSRRALLRL